MWAFQLKFNTIRDSPEWLSKRTVESDIPLDGHETASSYQKESIQSGVEANDGLSTTKKTNNTMGSQTNPVVIETLPDPPDGDRIRWADDESLTIGVRRSHYNDHAHRVFPMIGVGARLDLNNHSWGVARNLPLYAEEHSSVWKGSLSETLKYFASKGKISRNSQIPRLTSAEREKLGGVEYKAVFFLICIVPVYWLMFTIIGMISMGAWVAVNYAALARSNGLSSFWMGAFFAVSAFVNSGFSLLDTNMTALQTSVYPLLTLDLLILAGKTLYPCLLRFFIWILRHLVPNRPSWNSWRITLDFVLEHPKRVYTNLFPSYHTWYLLGSVIILNGISWALFGILSIRNEEIQSLPTGYRVLDGLFQALCVRSGGFYVVNITNLQQGLLTLYVLMMYISAFPVVIRTRSIDVYEERSLGIYTHHTPSLSDEPSGKAPNIFVSFIRHYLLGRQGLTTTESSRSHFIHQQFSSQFGYKIWWPVLGIISITIAESDHFTEQPLTYSTFNIMFEVFSAYSCVGISMGFPNNDYSFCGGWHPISKLILAAIILMGRHRDLPVAIDRAVMLPSESLAYAEEEDAVLRREQARATGMDKMPV